MLPFLNLSGDREKRHCGHFHNRLQFYQKVKEILLQGHQTSGLMVAQIPTWPQRVKCMNAFYTELISKLNVGGARSKMSRKTFRF